MSSEVNLPSEFTKTRVVSCAVGAQRNKKKEKRAQGKQANLNPDPKGAKQQGAWVSLGCLTRQLARLDSFSFDESYL